MVDADDAAPADIMPFAATEATLANGLRVIVVPTGFPHLVSLQIPVQTGSRNEVEPGKSGFAHFFEHMMFRGTPRFSAQAYQDILTLAGARQNAYTTDDYTNYHTTFAKEDLETILDIEADRFMNLDYAEADFRTEARAILGEYNKSASDPLTKLMEVQRDHAYRVHPYRHTTMGFIRDIEDMPNQYDYSRTFFDRWYRPQFTTIIVAGDVDAARTVALVEKYWGAWERGHPEAVEIPREPKPAGPLAVTVPWETATLPWVTLGFHGPAFSTTAVDYAALDILLDLTFGETSETYQDLVERRQLVDQLFPWFPAKQDPGLATIMARAKSPEVTPAVHEALATAISGAVSEPVTAARLAEAKSNMRYSFARTLDNSESIGATLARFVRFDRRFATVNELFRAFDRLTSDDLLAAARRYLTADRMVLTTLAHDALPLEATTPRPVAAAPEGRTPATFGEVDVASEAHLLRFKLLFSVGSAHDPAGKEGLALLSAEMIAEAGSSRMRIDEINRALFPLAGTFTAQVDREMTTFTGVVHRDNIERYLDIVVPQITAPGFREEDFARLRNQQRSALVQDLRSNNDEELGKERLQQLVYEGGPYGHPAVGTVAGLESISLDDVRAFVEARYCQANLSLGLTGAFPVEAKDRLRQELAGLPQGVAAGVPEVSPRTRDGIAVDIVKKETRSVAISFGHPITVTRAHPDFPALYLASAWLGEHRASHGQLFQRLREVRGLNYGNYSYIEAFPRGMYQFFPDTGIGRHWQLFEIWVRPVEPRHAVFALKAALYEVRQLIERGLDDAQFAAIRQYLAKGLYMLTKTQDQQLGYALDSRWFDTVDFVESLREAITGLTAANVNDAIRRHLSGHDLTVVMVAKEADRLREELLSGAFTAMAYDGERPADVLAEDRDIGALDLALRAETVTVTPVEDVFAR